MAVWGDAGGVGGRCEATGGPAWLFILEALLLAPSFKDRAFSGEEEVRLQVFHDPKTGIWDDLHFRNGAMGLTPYVEISLKGPETKRITAI